MINKYEQFKSIINYEQHKDEENSDAILHRSPNYKLCSLLELKSTI